MDFERAGPVFALLMFVSVQQLHAVVPDPLAHGYTHREEDVAFQLIEQQFADAPDSTPDTRHDSCGINRLACQT